MDPEQILKDEILRVEELKNKLLSSGEKYIAGWVANDLTRAKAVLKDPDPEDLQKCIIQLQALK